MVVDACAPMAKSGTVAGCLVLVVTRGIYAIVHFVNALYIRLMIQFLTALITHNPATTSSANMNYMQNWAATEFQTAKTLSVLRSELILPT
jgi:hypothetical protein